MSRRAATSKRRTSRAAPVGARPYNPDEPGRFAVGPYDLSTVKLPFGTELQALGEGFRREMTMQEGYSDGRRDGRYKVTRSHYECSRGHSCAWILADSRTGLLRSQTAAELFEGEVKTEMVD